MTSDADLERCVGDTASLPPRSGGSVRTSIGTPEGFADLLSLDDVDHLISSAGLRLPAFRLVRQGKVIPPSGYTKTTRTGSQTAPGVADSAAVFAHFDPGATIVLQGMHRYWSPVGMLRSQPRSSARPSGTGQCLCHSAWIAGLRRPQGRPRRPCAAEPWNQELGGARTARPPADPGLRWWRPNSGRATASTSRRTSPLGRHPDLGISTSPWASSPSGRNS